MKKCPKCEIGKVDSEFNRAIKRKDGLQSWCRACCSAINRERYIDGRVDRKALRARTKAQREVLWKVAKEYLLAHPCVDCGEADLVVLDFDHVRGKKRSAVTKMIQSGFSIEALMDEIAKCDVRCANCHRRATARRDGRWWKLR